MSTVNDSPMTLEEQQKQAIQQIVEDQAAFDAQFREHHKTLLNQTEKMRDGLMSKISSKHKGLSPEVQEIVTLLRQQPILIPHVKTFIQLKLQQIADAINGALE
jgi:superfamily II RNA helicase